MGEQGRWTVERVMAAAPDSASAVAGRKLASPGPWSDVGQDGPVLWGHCRGSAKQAYQVVVDTAAPRYQCSCPSRKFPCKHVLGLLFRWAEGGLSDALPGLGSTPQIAAAESAPGVRRGGGGGGPGQEPPGTAEPDSGAGPGPDPAKAAAASARAEERDARVAVGLAELERWLADRVSDGLAALAARPELWEEMAARMVDAQAPGVARRLRRLATLPIAADDWAAQVLTELALLDLLARAYARREELPDDLLATVRAHLGFTVGRAEVLRCPAVADSWSVIGLHDIHDDERVATRRVWLRGRDTGRFAVVLLYSINGAPYEMTVAPGMELEADVHFFPGRPPLRALIGERRRQVEVTLDLTIAAEATVAMARDGWAAAVADDPWLTVWPAAVRGRLTAAPGGGAVVFTLVDAAGETLALCGPPGVCWQALAASGGAIATWLGELRPDGLNPLAFVDPELTHGELVVL
ncbi:MAG: SWIM zinc finger family protein [Propionibacteriaceae bacterium]|nr:SWIM zinc finger family protein [Propionibacteriaceae bacterium]